MSRRIVTAREQVEMLSPWRTATRHPSSAWQNNQLVGTDNFPLEALVPLLQRKEIGFADEKSSYKGGPPLSQQIREQGYLNPVEVHTDGYSARLIDGNHRIDNARTQGHTHVPTRVVYYDPPSDPEIRAMRTPMHPWIKGWLADMSRGRNKTGRQKVAERVEDFRWERSFDGPGGWILVTRNPDGNPVTVKTEPTRGQRSAALGPERPSIAININCTHQDYTGQILRGEKTIETRNTNSLRTLIGGRYGISRTHDNSRRFPATVVGYATLGEPKLYETAEDFDADYHLHRVGPESRHHFNESHTGVKFGYPLYDVESEPEPFPPGPGNRKWRSITALDKTLEQHLRDTYEPHPPGDPGLPESLVPHLMLPTDIAHHYREYDRPVDDENTRMLTRVIADQGIRQPLKISTDGTHAVLHEGNHRVNVARQLGISHVPVQVTLEKPGDIINNSGIDPIPLESVLGGWVDQNRHRLKSFWS
jgi:hypothetical protein